MNSQARVQNRDLSTHFKMLITSLATPHPVWRPVAHRNQHPAPPVPSVTELSWQPLSCSHPLRYFSSQLHFLKAGSKHDS